MVSGKRFSVELIYYGDLMREPWRVPGGFSARPPPRSSIAIHSLKGRQATTVAMILFFIHMRRVDPAQPEGAVLAFLRYLRKRSRRQLAPRLKFP
jgi:hypothetical protein